MLIRPRSITTIANYSSFGRSWGRVRSNTLLLNPEFVDSCRISHAAIPDDQTIKQIQLLAQKASERQNHEAQLASKYANEVFANDTRTWNQALLYEDNATYLLMGAGWKFCQDQANNTLEAIDLLKRPRAHFLEGFSTITLQKTTCERSR